MFDPQECIRLLDAFVQADLPTRRRNKHFVGFRFLSRQHHVDVSVVEDIYQDTYLRVRRIMARGGFEMDPALGGGFLSSYFQKALLANLREYLRNTHRRQNHHARAFFPQVAVAEQAVTDRLVQEQAEDATHARVHAAVATLPAAAQLLLRMKADGVSHRMIAAALAIRLSSVSYQLRKLRAVLKQTLQDDECQ